MQETHVWSLNWTDPLEKGMAPHSSILAWRIPWTGHQMSLNIKGEISIWQCPFLYSLQVKVSQSRPTLCDPMDYTVHRILWARITGVGSLYLQGIFPTQRLNPGLPHCRRILYQLSHRGSHLCSRIIIWKIMIVSLLGLRHNLIVTFWYGHVFVSHKIQLWKFK